jgi:two-component system, cell cycle sensor histidine kinase and response regulator CckA
MLTKGEKSMMTYTELGSKAQVKTNMVTILIIDDDDDDALITKKSIEKHMSKTELDVSIALNFGEALEELYSKEFDLILLDYRLGRQDGFSILESLQNSGITIPVIFLTGQGDENIAVKAMKSGAADYFNKSKVQSLELIKSIRSAIRSNQVLTLMEKELDILREDI